MTGNRRNELNPQDSCGGQGGRAEEEEDGGGDDGLIQKARLFPSPYHSSHSLYLESDHFMSHFINRCVCLFFSLQ